jgi:hypothetical protein
LVAALALAVLPLAGERLRIVSWGSVRTKRV